MEKRRSPPAGLALALALAACFAVGAAQVPFLGPCPPVTTAPDFDASRFPISRLIQLFGQYTGLWFEAERYFSLMEFAGRCVTTNFSRAPPEALGSDNSVDSSPPPPPPLLAVTDQTSWLTDIQSTIRGQMRPLDPKGDPAKMYTRYLPMDLTINHWVLDTDYDRYAVAYACTDIGSVLSTRYAWILTRSRHPPLEVMEKAYAAVDRNHLSRAFFVRVDQSEKNCVDRKGAPANSSSSATR